MRLFAARQGEAGVAALRSGWTVYWTTSTWDCIGWTTSVTHPDDWVTTYLYEGAPAKVTDPARNLQNHLGAR